MPALAAARSPGSLTRRAKTINQLIEDGFPYKAIIEKLTQDGLLPYPISEDNLSSWRLGGYEEWRREQQQKHLTAQLGAAALEKLAAILN